jgi:predicted RNase H-like nuclease
VTNFVDVVDQRPSFAVIALNAPVGYLAATRAGGRTCDKEARMLLGHRGSSIKSAPVRPTSQPDLDLIPDDLDAISLTLLARYREVAREMAPYRQRTIYEANSELSFFQLNEGVPLKWTKHSEKGLAERVSVLEARMVEAQRITEADVPGASISHLLDVAAVLWTARRVFARAAIRIPADPEWDEDGLRMELVR